MDLLCSRIFARSDIDMNLSEQLFKKLSDASNDWAEAEKKVIILEEGKKATFSKLVLKHKKLVKTISEAEYHARSDQEYKDIIEQYSEASMNLIKCRYHYNNIDKYVSLKQSELKRDLALNSKV
jgi:hypothetical protein